MVQAMSRPLQGVKILEAPSPEAPIGVLLAAAFCGRVAAGFGAEVTRLAPEAGDPFDALAPLVSGESGLATFLNHGKILSRRPAAGDQAVILASSFDVLITDAATAAQQRPRKVLVAIGTTPSPASAPASEFTAMARSGVLDLIGDLGRAPLPLPGHQPSYACGLAAYAGLTAALFKAATAGSDRIERVDCNLLDTLIWLNWKCVSSQAWNQRTPTRSGRSGEWPMLRASDGWVALVFRDVEWDALRRLVGDPRLDGPLFQSHGGRADNRQKLFDIIESWTSARSRAEILDLALAHRLPLGPVLEPFEVVADAQSTARDAFETVRAGGAIRFMPRLPLNWNGARLGGTDGTVRA